MNHSVLCLVALVAGISVTAAINTESGRLGCFDYTGSKWTQYENEHQKNSARFCRNMCQDYQFAGVAKGNRCACGDTKPPMMLPDSRCKSPCTGDPGQTCGGPNWEMEVFPVEPQPDLLGMPMGCFKDDWIRVWNTGVIKMHKSNSPQRCFNACREFKYAGLEAGEYCMCGDTLPQLPRPSTDCQMDCSGYVGKKCGGYFTLDVYELSETPIIPKGCVPPEYQQHGDLGTYKLYTERKTWSEAVKQCEEDDAYLIIINSEAEARFVRSLFALVPSETRMHAGFHDKLVPGSYNTLFYQPLYTTGYTKWSKKYPKKPSSVEHCGCLDAQAKLAQIDGNCAARALFVCEKLEPDDTVEPDEYDSTVEPEEYDDTVEPEEYDDTVEPDEYDSTVEPEEYDDTVEPDEYDSTLLKKLRISD